MFSSALATKPAKNDGSPQPSLDGSLDECTTPFQEEEQEEEQEEQKEQEQTAVPKSNLF